MIYVPKGLHKYCENCKHYMGSASCKAYPNGIPHRIKLGQLIHDKSLPAHQEEWIDGIHEYSDDGGKIFESK